MKKQDHLSDELGEQAPFLGSLKKSPDGFQVPPDYFSGLETEVFRQLEAIGAERKPAAKPARPSIWQLLQSLWQPRLALAFAGMLAVGLTAWWYFRPAPDQAFAPAFASTLTADDAAAYLMDNLMELDPEQIVQVLPAESLPSITLNDSPNNDTNNQPKANPEIQLRPEDLDDLLRDMTDEELKDLLL